MLHLCLSVDDILEFRLDIKNDLKLFYEYQEYGYNTKVYSKDTTHADIFLLGGGENSFEIF